MISMREINKIIVHHTGSEKLGGFDNPILIKLRHKYIKGFDDIGYHYLIGNGILTRDGKVYEGRNIKETGAHASGYNDNSIGIALIGNFEKGEPSERQWQGLVKLISRNCRIFQIPVKWNYSSIYGHNELEGTDTKCPGKFVDMNKLRRDVLEYMAMEDARIAKILNEEVFL